MSSAVGKYLISDGDEGAVGACSTCSVLSQLTGLTSWPDSHRTYMLIRDTSYLDSHAKMRIADYVIYEGFVVGLSSCHTPLF